MKLSFFILFFTFSISDAFADSYEITPVEKGYGFTGDGLISLTDGMWYINEVQSLVYDELYDILIIKNTNPIIVDQALTSVLEIKLNECSKAFIGTEAHGLSFSKYVAFARVGQRVLKIEYSGEVKDHYGPSNRYASIDQFLADKDVCTSQIK